MSAQGLGRHTPFPPAFNAPPRELFRETCSSPEPPPLDYGLTTPPSEGPGRCPLFQAPASPFFFGKAVHVTATNTGPFEALLSFFPPRRSTLPWWLKEFPGGTPPDEVVNRTDPRR